MLAQNFKTAAELSLTEAQHDALRKTLVLMETGRVTHVDPSDFCDSDDNMGFTGHFNMDDWSMSVNCGTVACIGGTACLVAGDKNLFNVYYNRMNLHDLFYPQNVRGEHWRHITVEQAARALRSYLTTGDARWKEAVS